MSALEIKPRCSRDTLKVKGRDGSGEGDQLQHRKKHQRCNVISRKEFLRISEQHRDAPAIYPTSTRPFGHLSSDLLADW